MTIKEIRKGAPKGAQGYVEVGNNIHYVRKILGVWRCAYNYDCGTGWALLNTEYIVRIKPL